MKKTYTTDELIQIVTDSFEAERTNNVALGKKLITKDFQQRGMFISKNQLFPIFSGGDGAVDLTDAYAVEGREFHIWNVAANEKTQTVFVELAEVEPRTEKTVVWPYVLVCTIEGGKIKRSRHYGDPATVRENISLKDVQKAVRS